MGEAHHDAVFGFSGRDETIRQAFALDGQRMITRRGEGVGNILENSLTAVLQRGEFAMHGQGCPHDAPAKGLADRLMAEAYAQDRQLARRCLDQIQADPGPVGVARARRENDALGPHRQHIGGRQLVVATNLDAGAELAQEVVEVVGEAVVVIDQDKHFQCLTRRGLDASQGSAAFITGRSERRKQGAEGAAPAKINDSRAHAIVRRCSSDSPTSVGAAPSATANAVASRWAERFWLGLQACDRILGHFSSPGSASASSSVWPWPSIAVRRRTWWRARKAW